MEVTIQRVLNGWLLIHGEDVHVYQADDEDMDVGAFISLLWDVNELVGPATSRYSAARVSISIVPGDKHNEGEP